MLIRAFSSLVWLASTLVLAVSCQPVDDPDPLDAAQSITSDWLIARLAALSSDLMEGRDNLSPGGERAREYLVLE